MTHPSEGRELLFRKKLGAKTRELLRENEAVYHRRPSRRNAPILSQIWRRALTHNGEA